MSEQLNLQQRVELARLGGKVERCHMIPHQGSYSNAAHSWGVAMLMLQLWPEDFPRLAGYCICHDVPEAWVGDIPAHTKQRLRSAMVQELAALESEVFQRLQLPDEGGLSQKDRAKLKACDALELWLWAREQIDLGNWHAMEVYNKLEQWFFSGEHRALPPPAQELWQRLRSAPVTKDKSLALRGY